MELDSSRWLVRWYFCCVDIWSAFFGGMTKTAYDVKRSGTNLCHFVQLSFLWGPFALLLTLAMYAGALYVATVGTVKALGFPTVAVVLGTILALIAVVVLVVIISERRPERRYRYNEDVAPKPPSIIWEYLKARKQKICPMISFARSR